MKRVILILILSFMFLSFGNGGLDNDYSEPVFDELTADNLYDALIYYEIKFPKEVLAQSILETGNFTSELCKKNNNILGLYDSYNKRYYKFDHWTDCIEAYKTKVEYKHRDGEDYYLFLSRIGYASDPMYVKKIKDIIKIR